MEQTIRHKFRSTTLQLMFFLSLLVGVGIAPIAGGESNSASLATLCIVIGTLALLFWRQRNLATIMLVVVLGLGLGLWRGSEYRSKLAVYDDLLYQEVVVTVSANEDATYNDTKQLAFTAGNIRLRGRLLAGKLQVSGVGLNIVLQGDEIAIKGKIYPSHGAYQGKINFAKLSLVARHPSIVSDLRRRFTSGMQTALPEPLAPFAMGLLVGQRATLPDKVKQDLLMVGLTHIIAVSGYNLTIILRASQKLLAGQSKRLSVLLSLSLIFVFLSIAGNSASIVRAAIVSTLSIAAGYYGRDFKPLNLLIIAGVITAWANPTYIWRDLGWYLSFLAFFGVMVLSPLIQKRWPANWHQTIAGSVALESICAEIMCLPFILHIFGQMSFVGLPANVMVVGLVPLAMLLGMVAGLAGVIGGSLAGLLAWPAYLLLNYMLDIAHLMSHLPHAFAQNISLSLLYTITAYVLIGLVCLIPNRKTKSPEAVTITDMNEATSRTMLV